MTALGHRKILEAIQVPRSQIRLEDAGIALGEAAALPVSCGGVSQHWVAGLSCF